MPRRHMRDCPECRGMGEIEDGGETLTCSDCDGTGEIEVDEADDESESAVLRT